MNHKFKQFFQRFKRQKRAFYSLILLAMLMAVCLPAEIIANDKPLFVSYKSQWYFPVFKSYSETTFGGDFTTEADYKDSFVQDLITEQGGSIIWPIIPFSFDSHIDNLHQPAPSPPSAQNLLGTDDQARDVLARIIYGFRISILFAVLLSVGSSIIGVIVGAAQGYLGGLFDLLGQRFLEVWQGLPLLFVLIILASIITPSFTWLLFIMLLFSWTSLVDVVRAETLKVRKLDYVTAAKALGLPHRVILIKHVLPNALVAVLSFMPFLMSGAIVTLTSLDFLGFGLPPGSASLGELLAQGKNNVQAPWLGLSGFFSIALLLSLLVFIGEGVRDALDPRWHS